MREGEEDEKTAVYINAAYVCCKAGIALSTAKHKKRTQKSARTALADTQTGTQTVTQRQAHTQTGTYVQTSLWSVRGRSSVRWTRRPCSASLSCANRCPNTRPLRKSGSMPPPDCLRSFLSVAALSMTSSSTASSAGLLTSSLGCCGSDVDLAARIVGRSAAFAPPECPSCGSSAEGGRAFVATEEVGVVVVVVLVLVVTPSSSSSPSSS